VFSEAGGYSWAMPVTRDDVARLANVSVATVSYVLNGGPKPVSAERRARVLDAVAALGYRPNAIARSLRARRTNIVGLVLPDSANPYFARLSRAIEDAAAARSYQVIVSNAGEDPRREASQIEALLRLQVDGLIWIPADVARVGDEAIPPIPTVQVDRALPRALPMDGAPRCDVLVSDNYAGGRLAAQHVVELGHRRIAFISGPAGHFHADERRRGVSDALAAAGAAIAAERIAHGDFTYAAGAAIARRWCRLPAPARPTAILCANDAMAIGVLSAAAGAGLRVPDALSVVGYDDVPQAQFTVPPLTTVAQCLETIAAEAVACLIARIERPAAAPAPALHRYPVRLVARDSTTCLRDSGVCG
jgi:LacI family transcriptional regulator